MRTVTGLLTSISIIFLLLISSVKGASLSKLVVMGDHDFPPYEFLENGRPTGFNIDLIRAVAETMGLEIEIRLGPWNEALNNLQQKKIDLITGMAYSEVRDLAFDFSVPHTKISPGLFTRADSPIKSLNDIHDREIVVQLDDIMHNFLVQQSPTTHIITVQNPPEALQLIATGKHDGALLSSEVLKYYLSKDPVFSDLKNIDIGLPMQNYCFAVAEGNTLLINELDRGLIRLKANGTYQNIYNKWFGVYEEKRLWDSLKFYVFAMLLIVGFFIFSLVWSWTLKKQVNIRTTELNESQQNLIAAQTKLEKRVQERTADLALTNENLRSEIIEREKMEVALRDSEEGYRAIVEAFDGLIYICSADYRIEFMNQNLIDAISHDATGEICYEAIMKRDTPCQHCANDRVMQGETVRFEIQLHQNKRWYYVVNTPIFNSDNSISKQAMVQDITSRVKADKERRELEEINRKLQKAKSLDRMAGATAHHFNNKLHVVLGKLDLARQTLTTDKNIDKYLKDAGKAAEQAAEISKLMLTYLGKVSDPQSVYDLSAICNKGLSTINELIPKHINLSTSIPSPGPSIQANFHHIQLILLNIIRNSWEAIDTNEGTIALRIANVSASSIPRHNCFPVNWTPVTTNYACIEVADNGCGFEDKDIETAFDPFYSTKFTGRGLGLSVVLGLVQAHNGVATVESTPGRGTTISVFFPQSSKQPSAKPANQAKTMTRENSGTVLLVDDDTIVLEITAELLSRMGFDVLTEANGIDAIETFKQHKDHVSLILTDYAMPQMNGLEMLSPLREIAPGIPVILASGYSEDQVMSSNHTEKPQVFLEKPYSLDDLKEAVNQSLACPV